MIFGQVGLLRGEFGIGLRVSVLFECQVGCMPPRVRGVSGFRRLVSRG